MQDQPTCKLIFWALVTFSCLLCQGWAGKCDPADAADGVTVQQTRVGKGDPPKFVVEVSNNCPRCPAINVHLKCGGFPQALVNPRMLKVLSFDDCVVNAGLPVQPLQKFSFNYTHNKFLLRPSSWDFQCE